MSNDTDGNSDENDYNDIINNNSVVDHNNDNDDNNKYSNVIRRINNGNNNNYIDNWKPEEQHGKTIIMIMETKLNNDSKNGSDTLLSFFREVKSICKFHALKTTGIRLMAS